jgi:hypothetical protein
MRTRRYLVLLVIAVVLGAPIAFAAYWFLTLTELVQHWAFIDLPHAVGLSSERTWWPVPPLAAAGLGEVFRGSLEWSATQRSEEP